MAALFLEKAEMVFESKTLEQEVLLEQKAADLFAICDQEDKGFVTKRDMQRLKDELPLGPDQLENVFDALDQDHNGYLTLEEFTNGFEDFLGLTQVRNVLVIQWYALPIPNHFLAIPSSVKTLIYFSLNIV